jgi:hypothetical protein
MFKNTTDLKVRMLALLAGVSTGKREFQFVTLTCHVNKGKNIKSIFF